MELLFMQSEYVSTLNHMLSDDNIKAYNDILNNIRFEGEDTEKILGLAGSDYYKSGSTAYLKIKGIISKDWTFETWVTGGRPLTHLQTLFLDAENDPSVDSIQMIFDSPGGYISGVSEFFDIIHNSSKLVTSHVQGTLASAAYWLASASDSITATKTSVVGSIGSMLSVTKKKDEDEETYTYRSVGAELKNAEPGEKGADDQYQKFVDDGFAVMKEDIAKGRGISTDDVISKYGNGAVFMASEAITREMIDAIDNRMIIGTKDKGVSMADNENKEKDVVAEATIDRESIVAEERKRASDIRAMACGDITEEVVTKAINEGWDVAKAAIEINKKLVAHAKTIETNRERDAQVVNEVTGSLEDETDEPDTKNALGLSAKATEGAVARILNNYKGAK